MQLLIGGPYTQNGAFELRKAVAGHYLAQKKGAKLETVADWVPAVTGVAEVTKIWAKK